MKGISMNYMKTMFLQGKMVGAQQLHVVQHTEIHSFNSELTSNNILENRSLKCFLWYPYIFPENMHIYSHLKCFVLFFKKKIILYSNFVV